MARAHLMPAESASGATLHTIVAVMSFLACLTLGAVLTLSHLAGEWTKGLAGSVTVQLMPSDQIPEEEQAAKTLQIVKGWPGIFSARVLSRAEAAQLLEPWLGTGNVLADLPVPQLVEVQLSPGKAVDFQALREALNGAVPGAELDDHQRWNQELAGFARSSVGIGWGVLALITVAMLAIIVFATQAGLHAHRDIVEVVHMIGAKDEFIAREFDRHFLWLGLRGGLFGLALALVTLFIVGLSWDARSAPGLAEYAPQILTAPLRFIWLLLVPAGAALIAMYTARLTVMRVLSNMP
jgi:cell division transport system permease protein